MSEGKVKRKIIFLIFAAVMVVAGGCGTDGGDTEASRDLFAMDTYMTVTAYGKGATEAVDQAADEISRLDQLLSTGNEDSEIYKINQSGDGILSEETAYLVERSLDLYEATDGAFDIAIYPVMKAWGFTDDNFRVPDADELRICSRLQMHRIFLMIKRHRRSLLKRTKCRSTLEESRKVILLHVSWIFFVPAGSRADWSILVEMCRHLEQRRMEAAGAWQCRTHRIQISILGCFPYRIRR